MSFRNGYLPSSELAPIGGGYYLRKDAAAAFRAMSDEAFHRYGVHITVVSAYRPYAKQVYLYSLYRSGRGNLAAYPGSSNHGWGLAVDLSSPRMRWIVDQIGRKYGFSKAWSDAPSEWWHIKWRPGVWRQPKPKPKYPTLHRGSKGLWVKRCQNALQRLNVKGAPKTDGVFGPATEKAVKRLQRKHGLPAAGVVGPRTWKILLTALRK